MNRSFKKSSFCPNCGVKGPKMFGDSYRCAACLNVYRVVSTQIPGYCRSGHLVKGPNAAPATKKDGTATVRCRICRDEAVRAWLISRRKKSLR